MDWAWVWFFFTIVAFVLGYLVRGDLRTMFTEPAVTLISNTATQPLGSAPAPSLDPGYCTFPSQDLTLKQVYDYNGLLVNPTKIPCSNCNQYVSRDEDGCVTYGYAGEGGVCTIGGFTANQKKTCSGDTDCAKGSRCVDKFCNAWEIQPSKSCPAGD